GDEDAAHVRGRHAVGEAGGEERAAADADVAVEVGQVEAVEGFVERAQRAEFVHAADRAAAGDGQADPRRGVRGRFAALPGRVEGEHAGAAGKVGRSVADRCRAPSRRSSPAACENDGMPRPALSRRLERRLACHQALHDPEREPRNRLRWLPELRRWQAARLRESFAHFLADPSRRPAAEFFLDDVYGDRDFTRRDADIARVLPMMQRLLPEKLLGTVADAIELGALTQALDLRMAQALQALAPKRRKLDAALYADAYREVGLPRLRSRQIGLIRSVGSGFGKALKLPGVAALLAFSRGPAKLAGLSELQGFLERGVAAFEELGDADAFVAEIERAERKASKRLFAGHPDPFA